MAAGLHLTKDLEQLVTTSNKKLSDKNQELDELKAKLNSMKIGHEIETGFLKDVISSKNSELEVLKQNDQSCSAKVCGLQKLIATKNSKITDLENVLKQTREKFDCLSKTCEVLERGIPQLERRVANLDNLSKKDQVFANRLKKVLNTKSRTLRMVRQNVQMKNLQHRTKNLKVRQLKKMTQKTKLDLKNSSELLVNRKSTSNELEKVKKVLTLESERMRDVEKNVLKLNVELETLRKELSVKVSTISELETKNKFLIQNSNSLNKKIENLEPFKASFENCRKENVVLKSDLERYQKKMVELEKSNTIALRTKVRFLESSLQIRDEKMKEQMDITMKTIDEKKDIEKEVHSWVECYNKCSEELETSNRSLALADDVISKLKSDFVSIKNSNIELQNEMATNNKNFVELSKRMTEKNSKTVKQFSSQHANMFTEFMTTIKDRDSTIVKLQNENENLKFELRSSAQERCSTNLTEEPMVIELELDYSAICTDGQIFKN